MAEITVADLKRWAKAAYAAPNRTRLTLDPLGVVVHASAGARQMVRVVSYSDIAAVRYGDDIVEMSIEHCNHVLASKRNG